MRIKKSTNDGNTSIGDGNIPVGVPGLYVNWLIVIVILAVAVRLACFALFAPWTESVEQQVVLLFDARGYHDIALQILDNRSFEKLGAGLHEAFRTPGYPLFIAAIYDLFGANAWKVLLAQIFLSAGTVVLVFRLARYVAPIRVSLVAALVYALEPHVVLYSLQLYSDSLFVFLFLAALVLFCAALQKGEIRIVAIAGFMLGLSALVRPTAQFFMIPLAALALVFACTGPVRRLLIAGTVIVASMLTMFPWAYKNFTEYGHASLSAQGGDYLLNWIAAYTESARSDVPVEIVRREFAQEAERRGFAGTANPFERSKIQSGIANEYLRANFGYYTGRHMSGIVHTFLNLDTSGLSQTLGLRATPLADDFFAAPAAGAGMIAGFLGRKSAHEIIIGAVVVVFLLVIYSAVLVGSWVAVMERRYTYLAVAGVTILYFCAFVGPIGLARYKLPMIPVYLPLAALGLVHAGSWFNRRHRSQRQVH